MISSVKSSQTFHLLISIMMRILTQPKKSSACTSSCLNVMLMNARMHLSVAPITDAPIAAGCSGDLDCPDYAACENRLCINPCAIRDPCAPSANCKVVNHNPVCTCPDGYIGDPRTDCRLRK